MDKIPKYKKSAVTLKISGMFRSEGYHQSKIFARKLWKHHKQYFGEPVVKGFLEVDWISYLSNLQRTVGGQTWAIRHGVVVFVDDVFIGGDEQLFEYYKLTYECRKPSSEAITNVAKQEYLDYLNKTNLLYTYMDFSLDQEYLGTLLFELQVYFLPKTCSRFAFFCDSNNHTSYKGSKVLRVCKNGWFQAGRLNVQSKRTLNDESFCYPHDRRGIISFANSGINTNHIEFFVTLSPSKWMDQRYVAFGRVVEGWDLLRRIENVSCTYESPDKEIVISNCGLANAGFRIKITSALSMKGITVGEPHIDLKTFQDLILDYLMAALFDRLDEAVKRELNADWVAMMVWSTVEPSLRLRQPVEDVGSHPDVPQHCIKELLDELLYEGLARHEITSVVKSIVSLVLNSVEYRSESELAAQDLLNNLVSEIELIIYGPKEGDSSRIKSSLQLPKTSSNILSEGLSNKTSSSKLVSNSGIIMNQSVNSLGVDQSLADYIWGILLNKITIRENKLLG